MSYDILIYNLIYIIMVKYTHNITQKNTKLKNTTEDTKPKKEQVTRDMVYNAFNKSIKMNYIFYISVIISAYILSLDRSTSVICIILSLICISAQGYFIHYLGHKINFSDFFYNSNSILKDTPIFKSIIGTIASIFDFHSINSP